ncbi:MAG: hypothetical protein Q7J27_05565 [Syntrophales bacterium]|nr:hypothetical protein [Syntrophales bacterium]
MLCALCREKKVAFMCDGCGVSLCRECVKYSVYGTGCGCITPLYLCPVCFDDPDVNQCCPEETMKDM